MKEFFQKLAIKENGNYSFSDETVSQGYFGPTSPHDIHLLILEYKSLKIEIKNEIGVGNGASISCKLPLNIRQTEFSISTLSHFFKLFKRDKESFIIKCKNDKLKKFIATNKSLNEIQSYTLETQFELIVYGEIRDGRFVIRSEYNLIFENREPVLIALIQFYKDLIDKLYY